MRLLSFEAFLLARSQKGAGGLTGSTAKRRKRQPPVAKQRESTCNTRDPASIADSWMGLGGEGRKEEG